VIPREAARSDDAVHVGVMQKPPTIP
jgi:hypothetical protein